MKVTKVLRRVVVVMLIQSLFLSPLVEISGVISFFLPKTCYAAASPLSSAGRYEEVSIPDLVAAGARYDNRKVTIKGEAIGDLMVRKDGVWVNVLDNGVAVGVFMSKESCEKIKILGRHGYRGDFLEIWGVFNRACPVHSGEPDVHCEDLVILERGQKVPIHVAPQRVYLAAASLLVSGILYVMAKAKGKMR